MTIQRLLLGIGIILLIGTASCAGGIPPLATPRVDSAADSRPPALNVTGESTLPEICNCVLRFESISIEQGLSQSSVRVIFQDRRGFLWFGTEDGLNRYDGYSFKVHKREPSNPNSISDGWITAIAEDQDGYLWVGTRLGGVNRYDPATDSFTQYLFNEEDPGSLSDNHVSALLVDKTNHLWVGTLNGLNRFNAATGSFHRFPYLTPLPSVDGEIVGSPDAQAIAETIKNEPGISIQSEKVSSKNISTIYQDSFGRIWIGTLDGGLNGFDAASGEFILYQSIENNPTTISSDRVTSITEDKEGRLWVGTQKGLNLFDPANGQFTYFVHDRNNPDSLVDNSINVLQTDSTGNLWIGTSNGLERLKNEGDGFVHYQNDPSFLRSLSNNFIISIFEDQGGVLWFGTYGGGVNRYDRNRDKFAYYRHDPKNPESLSNNFIFPIEVDEDGFAWLGTSGGGLNRFNWRTGEIVRYANDSAKPDSLGSNWLLSIFEDSDGILWIGTTNGLDRFNPISQTFTHFRHDPSDPESLSANYIYSIQEDSEGQLWLGTSIGLDLFDKKTGKITHYRADLSNPAALSGNKPLAIHEDGEGMLWVGTSEFGLNLLDPATGIFTRFMHNPRDEGSISSDSILSIYQDTKDRLWIGTAGGGLNLYHSDTGTFTYYLEKDGLPNGYVYGILEDDFGRLWLSTNFGISRFDPDTETFRNYDMANGLQSNEFNSNAYAKGMDGEFYFGGINGLTVFHPAEITDNRYLPQVALTSITLEDLPVPLESSVETTQSVTLTWPQNSFEFEFAALSFNQPAKNQYAYTLDGFDAGWHFIGTKRDGRYTNLPGGQYTLLLKAANSDGVWSNTPTRINVTVIPPFWQTFWFRVLMGIAAVGVVAGGFRLRTKSIQDRNRELERLVQERTHALETRGREMEALYLADEKILRNVSINQVFQTLVDVAVEMLHADRSVVFAWDDKQTKVVPRVSHGFSPKSLKALEFSEGEGIVGQVLTSGRAVLVANLDPQDLRSDVREAIVEEGIKSFVHLPIVVDHKVIAVFNVGFTHNDPVGDDAIRLFSALTHRASLSIANMELFEQTKDLAVMEERNRLARDLHDSAKQKAFAALAQLGTIRGILNGNGNKISMHLNEAENLVSDVIQELTFLVQEIYPIALQEKGLAAALRDYIYEWENRNDASVQLMARNDKRLHFDVEQALYRVTQEALANVARHSRARRVDISLVYNGDSVQLSLSDDGCGFDIDSKSYGMGLRSIRERISSIHGTVQIQSAPGHGTRILIQAPAKG
ncbi:MAG TPA: two-component regulator propeller domain-containing protein [Anaerolineales bacterium]|nr:two-component regulator propeller domain-containing protein [Anaerolineales bacterium]